MTYRKILDGPDQTVVESSSAADVSSRPSGDLAGGARSSPGISGRDDSVDDEMHHYTRVQILAQLFLSANERQGPFSSSIDFSDGDSPESIIDFDFSGDMSPIIDPEAGAENMEGLSPNSPLEVSAEPLDMPTTFPVPQPSRGGGQPSGDASQRRGKGAQRRGKGGQRRGKASQSSRDWGAGDVALNWACHNCHHILSLALSPERCVGCQHHRCIYCQFC